MKHVITITIRRQTRARASLAEYLSGPDAIFFQVGNK